MAVWGHLGAFLSHPGDMRLCTLADRGRLPGIRELYLITQLLPKRKTRPSVS